MKRFILPVAAVLALGLTIGSVLPSVAQGNKMAGPSAAQKKTYYVCAKCKVYFSEAAAKKAAFKDSMGHKLTKSTTIPKGYKDAGAMKKAGKSDTKM